MEDFNSVKYIKLVVDKAVNALYQYREKQQKKDSFLIDGENIYMQLTFKLVPDVNNKIVKIPLPNTLMRPTSDVCLFVKDLDKNSRDSDPTIDHFKDLLSRKGITNIAEVIPLKALKLEYSPYEAKRNLSNMYDFFLADERIMRLLPSVLGKSFYGRKRHPIGVDLLAVDLKHELDRALNATRLIISGRGSNVQVAVAHTTMSEEQVVANVMAVALRLSETLPGGAVNIRNIYLRLQDSPALPVYVSSGSKDEVKLPERKRELDEEEPEEISTVSNKKVKISPIGEISFYTMDGKLLTKEKPDKPDKPQRPKRMHKKRTTGKGKAKGNVVPEVKAQKAKKVESKVNRLAPKEDSDKSKQKKDKKNIKLKSLEKKDAAKSGIKNKPKSKKMKA